MSRVQNRNVLAMKRALSVAIAVVLICGAGVFIGCSGGGDSDGSSGDGESLSRSTGTGVRLIHASIDTIPLQLRLADAPEPLQSARYAQPKFYRGVAGGAHTLVVEGMNAADVVVYNSSVTFSSGAEYTVFVHGVSLGGRPAVSIFEDPVGRPEAGRSRFQVLNGFYGGGEIEVSLNGEEFGPVVAGSTSGAREVSSGVQTAVVRSERRGEIASVSIDLLDRGDITLVVAGSADLGVVFTPVYQDLD